MVSLVYHLAETILLRYLSNTIILMLGVGLLALLFGISRPGLCRYEFRGGGGLAGCCYYRRRYFLYHCLCLYEFSLDYADRANIDPVDIRIL